MLNVHKLTSSLSSSVTVQHPHLVGQEICLLHHLKDHHPLERTSHFHAQVRVFSDQDDFTEHVLLSLQHQSPKTNSESFYFSVKVLFPLRLLQVVMLALDLHLYPLLLVGQVQTHPVVALVADLHRRQTDRAQYPFLLHHPWEMASRTLTTTSFRVSLIQFNNVSRSKTDLIFLSFCM